jgi:hypothetical protein
MYVLKTKLVFPTKSGAAVAIATLRTAALLFLSLSAQRATLRVVGKAFRREEFLFPSSEGEGSPAIGAEN